MKRCLPLEFMRLTPSEIIKSILKLLKLVKKKLDRIDTYMEYRLEGERVRRLGGLHIHTRAVGRIFTIQRAVLNERFYGYFRSTVIHGFIFAAATGIVSGAALVLGFNHDFRNNLVSSGRSWLYSLLVNYFRPTWKFWVEVKVGNISLSVYNRLEKLFR